MPHPAFRLGPVYRGQFGEVLSFLRPTVHTVLKCPHFPGTITAEWFWLCVRSQCHHIWRMRTFDENSCAISITSPRSLSPLRTQHVWWDHWEKSRRASTLWDCRGKSHLVGLSPANGTQSERGVSLTTLVFIDLLIIHSYLFSHVLLPGQGWVGAQNCDRTRGWGEAGYLNTEKLTKCHPQALLWYAID